MNKELLEQFKNGQVSLVITDEKLKNKFKKYLMENCNRYSIYSDIDNRSCYRTNTAISPFSKIIELTAKDLEPDKQEFIPEQGKKLTFGTAQTAIHYQREGLEPIQEMQANYTTDEFIGFLKGSAKKYQDRLGLKNNSVDGMCEDITKAMQYLYWLKLHLQGVKIEPMKHVLEEGK